MPDALYLAEQQKQMLPGVVAQRRRGLPFAQGEQHVVLPLLEPGKKTTSRAILETIGQAVITAGGATDFGRTRQGVSEDETPTFYITSSTGQTFDEMRSERSALQQAQADGTKLAGVRRVIMEEENVLAAVGNTSLGVTGWLNNPLIATVNEATFNPYDAAATDLAAYLQDGLSSVVIRTGGAQRAGHILISIKLYRELVTKTVGANGDMTVLRFLLENDPDILSIRPSYECGSAFLNANGAGETNKDRIVFYPMEEDPEYLLSDGAIESGVMPMHSERITEPLTQYPQEFHFTEGDLYGIPYFKRTTPVIFRDVTGYSYYDVADAAA